MKQLFIFAVLALCLSSCKKESSPEPAIVDFINNKKAANLIEADTRFGFELFSALSLMETTPENFMISPTSVAIALGMTYNGAGSETKTAFEETLGYEGYSREEINSIHKTLMDKLLNSDQKLIIEIANSIWYREGFDVLQSFIDINKNYYDAEVNGLDFSDPIAKEVINDWCALKTHDKILEVLDEIPENVVMYLINAIYFNGTWTYQFDASKSHTGKFYKEDGTMVDAGYMMMQQDISYLSTELFNAVDLPYGNGNFNMMILLPKTGKLAIDIIGQLNPDTFALWTSEFSKQEVVLTIPKFKFGYKELLNEPLIKMGLGIAFSGNADFTSINPQGELSISRVIHQSFIDVNEKGTEAAAVTVVEIEKTSTGPEDGKVYFNANRPFIFLIHEKTSKAILFAGKVGDPKY